MLLWGEHMCRGPLVGDRAVWSMSAWASPQVREVSAILGPGEEDGPPGMGLPVFTNLEEDIGRWGMGERAAVEAGEGGPG